MNEKTITLTNVYDGQKMRLFGWTKPVVIDVAGLNIPGSVCPLLRVDENTETAIRVGTYLTITENGNVWMKLDGQCERFYSIGAEVEAAELVDQGERVVNGHTIQAPFYHVTKSTLREVMECADGSNLRIVTKENIAEVCIEDIKRAFQIGQTRDLIYYQVEGLIRNYDKRIMEMKQ